jgi:hypothetical protein
VAHARQLFGDLLRLLRQVFFGAHVQLKLELLRVGQLIIPLPFCILLVEAFPPGMAQMVTVCHAVHPVDRLGMHPYQMASLRQ